MPQEVTATFAGPPLLPAPLPTAAVTFDGSVFHIGQTITHQATFTPGLDSTQVDIYLGVLLPGGVTFLSLVNVSGSVSFVLAPLPIPLSTGTAPTPSTVPFSYTFTGSEPMETYIAYAGIARAGSDPLEAANQVGLAIRAFDFTP